MDSQVTSAELAGAAPYSPQLLRIYDRWVLGFNNSRVWRCPTSHVLDLYDRNVAASHLDIGPGTGWLLAHANLPPGTEVDLVDLNPHPLQMCGQRLRERGVPTRAHEGSVLHPLPVQRRFDSVAASLLMHCVPGGWDTKGDAFAHIADVTNDQGVFFGATVLNEPSTFLSRRVAEFFRRRGAFNNIDDDAAGLRQALERSWSKVSVRVVGQTALWEARLPRR
ncbi:class I SAM-dependent methyltransferase [Nocardia thailandica]